MQPINVTLKCCVIPCRLNWTIFHSTIHTGFCVTGRQKADLETEKTKITQNYERNRDEKTRKLLNRLNEDERMRAEHIIYEQTEEILQLSGKKVCLVFLYFVLF